MNHSVKEFPFWTSVNEIPAAYPWMTQDESCDVAVIGGGVAGAMCAYRMAQEGIDTVLVCSGAIGFGEASHSVGLMTCDSGADLAQLRQKQGLDTMLHLLDLGLQGLQQMDDLSHALPDFAFRRMDYLKYTDCEDYAEDLRDEYRILRHNQLNITRVEGLEAMEQYSFPLETGLLGTSLAAQCDPYRLCHALLSEAVQCGLRVYENTGIEEITQENGMQTLYTTARRKLNAQTVVIASGCAGMDLLPRTMTERTFYALATEPVDDFSGWPEEEVICRKGSCDLFLRRTDDRRILIGGLESAFGRLAAMLPVQKLAQRKWSQMSGLIQELFPGIRSLTPAWQWGGTTLRTPDSLPLIGTHSQYPNWIFALCPGGNGILWAELAGRLAVQLKNGTPPADAALLSPERFSADCCADSVCADC